MRGVIAISTCRGGSFLSDPPAFRPRLRRRVAPPKIQIQRGSSLKNSNRESLRLEIHVTQTKQKLALCSNRELEALFFGPSRGGCFSPPAVRPRSTTSAPQPTRHVNRKNSNREPLRRVRADDSARRNDEVSHLTQTKQTTGDRSNREVDAFFQTGSARMLKPATSRQYAPSSTRKIPTNPKNTTTTYPSFLLRLRTIPILYFVKFTRSFNRTMLRLERIAKRTKNEPAAGRKGGFSDQRTVRRV
jgi:hypothetical protein